MKSLTILIASLAIACANNLPKKCCNNDTNVMIRRKCKADADGKANRIQLDCESKYILNPHDFPDDENFTVDANGLLLIADAKGVVPDDEFCLVNFTDSDSEETYEIALVCFPQTTIDLEAMRLSFATSCILMSISIVFLLLTIYIYFRLPELRETQDKVTLFTIVCLTIFLSCLTVLQLLPPVEIGSFDSCISLSFVLYFWTMSYFAWLNCVILNVWKSIVLRTWTKLNQRRWYILNHIYAWTIAITLTVFLLISHSLNPVFGLGSCWFHNDKHIWLLFYVPISIMLGLNFIFCIWSVVSLTKNDFSPDTRKALRYKCFLYLKLFALGGVTWIFEVLSYTFKEHGLSAWFWFIIDAINCLHGVLVFLILIVWRQRIRKELAGKKILGITLPSKWANVDDDDEKEICLSEDKGKYDLIIRALK